jgi:hypothetical protein
MVFSVAGTVAHAEEPPVLPDMTVPTGEVDGAVVAVGLPPVPPSTVPDASTPDLPATSLPVDDGAVDPTAPPSTVVVAVGEPPVPPFTVPDAEPVVVASMSVAPEQAVVQSETAVTQSVDPQLPETGSGAARAIAVLAAAVLAMGTALKTLARRS